MFSNNVSFQTEWTFPLSKVSPTASQLTARLLPRSMVHVAVLVAFAFAAISVLTPTNAQAETPKLLGTFKDWSAYVYGTGAQRICYVMTEPKSSKPKNLRRGDTFLMVTHRPGDNIKNEISMRIGYVFNKTSKPFSQVGSDKFQMFSGVKDGGESRHWAWVDDPAAEARMIKAMRRGSDVIVKGTSSRGTLTTDRYSLSGISAALKRIDDSCK